MLRGDFYEGPTFGKSTVLDLWLFMQCYTITMSLRKVPHVPGEFYHIYNRGNSKQKIFNSDEDYGRFMRLLYLANGTASLDLRLIAESETEPFQFEKGEPQVSIGAYCLMPNHFHILLTPLTEDGVANFMKKLATA